MSVGEYLHLCLLGRATCSDRHPCPAHARWKAVAESTAVFFSRTTVAELLEAPGGAPLRPRLTSS